MAILSAARLNAPINRSPGSLMQQRPANRTAPSGWCVCSVLAERAPSELWHRLRINRCLCTVGNKPQSALCNGVRDANCLSEALVHSNWHRSGCIMHYIYTECIICLAFSDRHRSLLNCKLNLLAQRGESDILLWRVSRRKRKLMFIVQNCIEFSTFVLIHILLSLKKGNLLLLFAIFGYSY